MKSIHRPKPAVSATLLVAATLALVSWSPTPAGDNIIMNTGKITLSAGVFETKKASGFNNGLAAYPAVVVGNANQADGSGANVSAIGQGLLVGTNNQFGTPTGGGGAWRSYGAVIGEANKVSIRSSLVVGYGNSATPAATDVGSSLNYSGVFGYSNTTNQADGSLVVGYDNMLGRAYTLGLRTSYSMAIGVQNQVFSDMGWALGYGNSVNADRGIAIGTGARVETISAGCTALGRYNATTTADDVLVIGSGSDNTNRANALRVTSDGGVFLGRAQGDISMGDFQ